MHFTLPLIPGSSGRNGGRPRGEESSHSRKVARALEAQRRQTQPPARFSEGSLLREMERLGLGTPATRASILETLKERGYLRPEGKALRPTEKGRTLIALLRDREVASPELTATWEKALEGIWREKKGAKGYEAFLQAIHAFVRKETENILKMEVPTVRKEATPKMLAFAKKLAKQTGRKLESHDFDSVRAFIDETLQAVEKGEGLGTCACGKAVRPFAKGWRCEGGHTVWEETFGKRLTPKQALALLQGEKIRAKGLKGRSGKVFDATLFYSHEEGKVRLEF